MIIDFHTHYYPKNFLKEIERDGRLHNLEMQRDSLNRQVITFRGNAICTLTEEMNNVSLRLEDMGKHGVDKQVLSLSVPGVDLFNPESAQILASIVNDEIIDLTKKYPEHFLGIGTVPLQTIDFAIRELHRIMENGLIGVILGSNINGTFVDDEAFYPFLQEAEKLRAIVFLHSAPPVNKKGMEYYRLIPMFGFMMEVSLTLIRLVMRGILEKLPSLKIVVGQLGGTVPFLLGRIEKCFEAYPECKHEIKESPLNYFKRIWLDTVSFHPPALECAYKSWGSQKLIFGSDYPQVIGDARKAIESLEATTFTDAEKKSIYATNLLNLIGL